jgi:hypothetical protein
MTRGVGYGPVGVVPGVFMMSQEYRPSVVIRGIGRLNVPRGTFSGSGKQSVVNVPRGTLPQGPPERVPRPLRQKGQFPATGQGTQEVVRRPQ